MRDLMDMHTHTLANGHAYNTIYEMVKEAARKDIPMLGITEHAPKMPGSCHKIYFMNLKTLQREIFGVRVLFGAELNILDAEGSVDLPEDILKQLDIGIASIHPPCYHGGDAGTNTRAYINAMKNPYIHIIGHPDDGRFPIDYEMLATAAKEYHVLLEVNNSSLSPNSYRPGARDNYAVMLKLCKLLRVPVIMSSDAHTAAALGGHEEAKKVLKEADFPEELIANYSRRLFTEYVPKAE